jgi:O-antigen/teichoic acid export membrane protein
LASVVAAVAAFIGLPYVIERFFSTFVDSIPIVRIMGLAIVPATIIAILNATLLGRGSSKTVFTAGLAYIVSLIVGIAVLGQALGAVGLAVTLLAAQTIQATYLVLKRGDSSKAAPTKQNPALAYS